MTWLADKAAWVLGIAAAVWGAIVYFKRQGRKDEQAANTERALQEAKDASDIDTRVRNMPDSQLDEQLRNVLRKK